MCRTVGRHAEISNRHNGIAKIEHFVDRQRSGIKLAASHGIRHVAWR